MQKQYQTYVEAVKKVLRRYKADEFIDFERCDDQCMMKIISKNGLSSKEMYIESSDLFIPINREREYLKKSTVAYLKEQNLDPLLERINFREWQGYTDYILTSDTNRLIANQKRKKGASVWQRKKQFQESRDVFLEWPINVSQFWLSSFYGPRKKPDGKWGFHYAIDLAAVKGIRVMAAETGVVAFADYRTGYGNLVILVHDNNYRTWYAHLDSICVSVGSKINKGTQLGTVGSTGFIRKKGSDGSHLHFEVEECGKKVNPLYFLPSLRKINLG